MLQSADYARILPSHTVKATLGHTIAVVKVSTLLEIDVGQDINAGSGKFGKKNKRRALNTHVLCST